MRRFGRDESIQDIIHKCMVAMLGFSLYSYLYLKLAKCCFSYYLYVFSSTKLEKREEQVLSGNEGG
jgi:hypothetical protein